jgi:hypothetical protein
MATEFVEVLLDGSSILDNIVNFRIQRNRNMAVDSVTLRLADFSLYSQFDFALIPTIERIHVGTSTGTPKTDGSTSGTPTFTSASSDFTAEGVTIDDLIFVINSTVAADIGGWEIVSVGTTTLDSSHTFGSASTIEFIILKNQGKFFVEKPDVIESDKDIAIPSLWGRCGLARLTDPFVDKLTKTFPRKRNFSDIVSELVDEAGMDSSKVIIDIDDFVVPGNLLTISNQLPLDVITNLVRKTNGYVRCQKTGDLHIKKDFFHFGNEPIAQALGDDEVRTLNERTDYPEFGNRVLVRSVTPEAAQDVRVSLTLDTPCTRGDGRSPVPARAVVTDARGNPVANGTGVEWRITASDGVPIVFTFAHLRTLTITQEEVIVNEEKRASSIFTVSTDFPIVDVLGVYLKMDTLKLTNFFTGGSFTASSITLGTVLPFSNQLLFVDYIAGGIARNQVRSFAGAPENTVNFINAFVGRIRDTRTLCINNNRNISLSLTADPSEFNLCTDGQPSSIITALVRDNGQVGQRIGVNWSLIGLGTLSSAFTMVRTQTIDAENQTSENLFTVNTRYEIASVTGVWRADEGKGGTNLFTHSEDRTGTFDGKKIILGTNLPFNRERVLIEYEAKSITQVTYTSPAGQTGPAVAQIVAKIYDGTQLGITEVEEILLNFRCDGQNVNPNTGLPSERESSEPNCEASTAAAVSCNLGNDGSPEALAAFTQCVCGFLTGGGACGDTDEDCRQMCQNDYNANQGRSSLLCDTESADEFCNRETRLVSIAAKQDCLSEHNASTVDACVERCLDHEIPEEDVDELKITPANPIMDCGTGGAITLQAEGGAPPYTWSIVAPEGSPVLSVGGQDDSFATISPQPDASTLPNNFKAYHRNMVVQGCGHGTGSSHAQVAQVCFVACGPSGAVPDSRLGCSTITPAVNIQAVFTENPVTGCTGGDNCANHIGHCQGSNPALCPPATNPGVAPGVFTIDCSFITLQDLTVGSVLEDLIFASGAIDDQRSPADIANGCVPCGLAFEGAVVTVTDSVGSEAVATITTEN